MARRSIERFDIRKQNTLTHELWFTSNAPILDVALILVDLARDASSKIRSIAHAPGARRRARVRRSIRDARARVRRSIRDDPRRARARTRSSFDPRRAREIARERRARPHCSQRRGAPAHAMATLWDFFPRIEQQPAIKAAAEAAAAESVEQVDSSQGSCSPAPPPADDRPTFESLMEKINAAIAPAPPTQPFAGTTAWDVCARRLGGARCHMAALRSMALQRLASTLEIRCSLSLRHTTEYDNAGGGGGGGARRNAIRNSITAIEFDRPGALVACAAWGGRVAVHDFDALEHESMLCGREPGSAVVTIESGGRACALAWDARDDNRLHVAMLSAHQVHTYDLERCGDRPTSVLASWPGVDGGLVDVVAVPQTALVAASNLHGMVQLWDARASLKPICRATLAGRSPVRCLAAHPSGLCLFAGSDDGSLATWDVRSMALAPAPLRVSSLGRARSPCAILLALAVGDARAFVQCSDASVACVNWAEPSNLVDLWLQPVLVHAATTAALLSRLRPAYCAATQHLVMSVPHAKEVFIFDTAGAGTSGAMASDPVAGVGVPDAAVALASHPSGAYLLAGLGDDACTVLVAGPPAAQHIDDERLEDVAAFGAR